MSNSCSGLLESDRFLPLFVLDGHMGYHPNGSWKTLHALVCVCACEENKKVTQSVAPNKHNLQSHQSDWTVSVCWYHTCLCVSHFQILWWNHARTRASVRRPTAAAQEQRWSVVLVTTVTDPTRATAMETTTATVQGLWPPAHSCWWRPCYCARPSVSCEQLHFSL